MLGIKHAALSLGLVVILNVFTGLQAEAQSQSTRETTGAAAPTEPAPAAREPVGHRQPRAADLPAAPEKTASDRERERKDRELDRRLRICRNC